MIQLLSANSDSLKIAGDAIRDGKLVVLPTYTIYVLACSAFAPEPLAKIRAIRHSPADKPLTVVIPKDKIQQYARLDAREKKIIDVLLPAPACLYVTKKDHRLDLAVTYSDFLCVFWQDNEVAQLYQNSQTVLAITSANTKGLIPAKSISEAIDYFGDVVDLYLDGGPIRGSSASAHLDIRKDPVELKRAASHFPIEKIREILSGIGCRVV